MSTEENVRASAPFFDRELSGVCSLITSLFDVDVTAEAARPEPRLDVLFPEERWHVRAAVLKRQAEFAGARICARRVLARLGFEARPIIPQEDRSPCWPSGIVGSISHTGDLCTVVATRTSFLTGIGLDVENASPLSHDLEAMVCTPEERRWLERFDQPERGRHAKLIFSAKEAFYKCQYTISKTLLSFLDVELDLDPRARVFGTRFVCAVPEPLRGLGKSVGRWGWTNDVVVAGYGIR